MIIEGRGASGWIINGLPLKHSYKKQNKAHTIKTQKTRKYMYVI
jgi:hypothetical protein